MNKMKVKNYLQNCGEYGLWLLKHAVAMIVSGLLALLYYEAGKVRAFEYPSVEEVCQQRDAGMKKSTDAYVKEITQSKEVEANDEEK